MDILKTSKEMLGFVFGRLRSQEGIKKGIVTSHMSDEKIFKVLANARYKIDNSQTLTELESSVKKESGNYIFMYVSQKYEDAKKECHFSSPPYADVLQLTNKDFASKTTFLRNQIA